MSAALAQRTTTKPYAEIVTVTPELAVEWLGVNTKNRNIRPRHVQRLARDMSAGNWKMTGEPVKFSRKGALLDGQHRLTAIVESGVTVQMMVVYNLPNDVQSAMDSGSARTASDALGLMGFKNSAVAAAAARLAVAEEKSGPIGKFSATHGEIIAFLNQHPDMDEAVDYAVWAQNRVDCPPAIIAYTLWRLSQVDYEAAYDFWSGITEKVGLQAGDPVLALSHRLAQARRARETLTREAFVSVIFRAWNLRRDGKTSQRLHINSRAGGVIPVPVPR